ncbi:MAG TPA: hypothetical protein VG147_02190 [Solirubrobacteraceae bacterium]|jgi:hypothetical protein|nr:hypothetical protein [Solirubrobacteraceae bacterium]
MPTIEAQRTLVKSPPELWAELSDPTSLARHLGEFGEIRIARVEAETSVEWEAESASGRVELKPSGWGTKVTLTVVRETPEPVVAETEPIASAAEPEPLPTPDAAATEAEPAAEQSLQPHPAKRIRLLFARALRRRKAPAVALEQSPTVETEPPQPEAEQEPPLDLAAELAAELARVEATMAEQDAELLSAVLDRLGAAHHRPFSRG